MVQNVNVFKRNPGVAGRVAAAGGGDPLVNVRVQLRSARGEVVGSALTDEDGFYRIAYRHSGKPSTYQVTLPDLGTAGVVILKANTSVEVDLPVP